jgi:predicted membrane-bound spermidine synthase
MKLDINQIYHKYIIRVVIFAIFLYKNQIKNQEMYKALVFIFIKKRIPWKINLKLDTGIKLDKEEEREIILEEVLNGIESDYLSTVVATFKTPLKETTIEVNLKDEERYQKFLYD